MVDRSGRWALFVLAGAFIVAAPGCWNEGFMRQSIEGHVNLDGRPLPMGAIIFYPTVNRDIATGVNGGAMIQDGHFSLPRSFGIIPGDYHVAIRASDTKVRTRDDRRDGENNGPISEEMIPAKYNSETELMLKITDKAIKEVTFHLDSH